MVEDVEVRGIGTLAEAVGFLLDRLPLEPTVVDVNEVFGQASLASQQTSIALGLV